MTDRPSARPRRRFLARLSAGLLPSALAGLPADAATVPLDARNPSKPITIVTPYGPGGVSDAVARLAAQGLSDELGQPVIVLNKPGVGASVAGTTVLQAPRDGHTLMLVTAYFIYEPFLPRVSTVSLQHDFQPVALLARVPEIIVTSPRHRYGWEQFLGYWRAAGQGMNIASYGPGSEPEVAMAMLAQRLSTPTFFVPYKSGATAMQALAAGEADAYLTTVPTALSLVQGGQINAVALTGDGRLDALPGVPTLKELGVDFSAYAYLGLAVARGTPDALALRLQEAAMRAIRHPQIRARVEATGAQVSPLASGPYARLLDAERQRVGEVLGAPRGFSRP